MCIFWQIKRTSAIEVDKNYFISPHDSRLISFPCETTRLARTVLWLTSEQTCSICFAARFICAVRRFILYSLNLQRFVNVVYQIFNFLGFSMHMFVDEKKILKRFVINHAYCSLVHRLCLLQIYLTSTLVERVTATLAIRHNYQINVGLRWGLWLDAPSGFYHHACVSCVETKVKAQRARLLMRFRGTEDKIASGVTCILRSPTLRLNIKIAHSQIKSMARLFLSRYYKFHTFFQNFTCLLKQQLIRNRFAKNLNIQGAM